MRSLWRIFLNALSEVLLIAVNRLLLDALSVYADREKRRLELRAMTSPEDWPAVEAAFDEIEGL